MVLYLNVIGPQNTRCWVVPEDLQLITYNPSLRNHSVTVYSELPPTNTVYLIIIVYIYIYTDKYTPFRGRWSSCLVLQREEGSGLGWVKRVASGLFVSTCTSSFQEFQLVQYKLFAKQCQRE